MTSRSYFTNKQYTSLSFTGANKTCFKHQIFCLLFLLMALFGGKHSFAEVLTQNEFRSLNQHIRGNTLLSESALYALRDQIIENADQISSTNVSLIRSEATIQLYENRHGALFTSEGTQQFATTVTQGDGLALERTMHELYLAVFDAFDASLINDYPDFVNGFAFGSASYFPGPAEAPANPQSIYQMRVNASVPRDWGRPNLYSELPARRPTGAYVAPGSVAEVIVPARLVGKGYQIRVGAHSWDLSGRTLQRRVGRASLLYPINSTVTRVANPLGGNVYIEVPHLANDGIVTVQFKNTLRAPFFSARSFDRMTNSEWQRTERNHPGPWTDIESDKVMLSVPSHWVRDYDDPAGLMAEYDAAMDVVSKFMGKPAVRNKTMAFMQVDVLFRGFAFFPGYPMSNYPTFNSATPRVPLDRESILSAILFHEHGHATYMTKFANETEAAVHNLYVAVATELYGMSLQEAFSRSLAFGNLTEVTLADALNAWVLRDSFVNNINIARNESHYQYAGHADYVEIMDLFGIEVLQSFNQQLNIDFQETGFDIPNRNNHPADDRILRLSRAAGVDLTPLIHLWGVKPVNAAQLRRQLASENLLPSEKIYDRMLSRTRTVPTSQRQYDAFYTEMVPTLGNREFWDTLADNYDPARGIAAINRIQELVDIYFPDGRPSGATQVTFYAGANYQGATWTLSEGTYGIADVRNSTIGNDAISSIQIADGYSVIACQHGGHRGRCETFTSSAATLTALNNTISSLRVLSP